MTKVHVISDIHGSAEKLAGALGDADALVVLGDLLLYVDYLDPSYGIIADLFGRPAAQRFADLRKDHDFHGLRELGRELWAAVTDPRAAMTEAARTQYKDLFGAMPTPAYALYGNVDVPALWPEFRRPGVHQLDGAVAEIGGWTYGLVGGWVPKLAPRNLAIRFGAECTAEEYAAKIEAVDGVDVLCSHIPPAVPELRYDVVTRNFEVASRALLDAVHRTQPRYLLFGHVHQPLQQRTRIGRTECVNVGHFRATGRPFSLTY